MLEVKHFWTDDEVWMLDQINLIVMIGGGTLTITSTLLGYAYGKGKKDAQYENLFANVQKLSQSNIEAAQQASTSAVQSVSIAREIGTIMYQVAEAAQNVATLQDYVTQQLGLCRQEIREARTGMTMQIEMLREGMDAQVLRLESRIDEQNLFNARLLSRLDQIESRVYGPEIVVDDATKPDPEDS